MLFPFNPEYFLQAPVALAIMLSTIAVSIWGLRDESLVDRAMLIPYDMLMYKEYWRIATSGWVHGSYLHLTFNMLTFYFFSFSLEHRLGHWQFGLLYILALILSNGLVVLRYRKDTSYEGSVGASGALSAVILSAVVCNPYLKFGLPFVSQQWPVLQLPGYIVAGGFILYSFVNLFRKSEMQINHDAHLWGAVAGLGLTFVLKPSVTQILGRFIENF